MIHAHSGQLADFDFSPFDDNLLASSGDDAHIKLWSIPSEGMTGNINTHVADLTGTLFTFESWTKLGKYKPNECAELKH